MMRVLMVSPAVTALLLTLYGAVFVEIQSIAVQLMFRGVSYPNNSVLPINDIGVFSTGSAILCTTNKMGCCATHQLGHWYYPDGSVVLNNNGGQDFYITRRDNQAIYLNRRNNAQSPSGSFCCELPDNNDVNHRVCVIVNIPVQLIFRGVSYPNNSVLSINVIRDISTGSAIFCTTNKSPCCRNPFAGDWYYPNGSVVPNNAAGEDFSRGRGDNQTIWLNRRNNAQSPNGSFCCTLPDASDVMHTLCVNLVIVPVEIIFQGVSYSKNSVLSLNDIGVFSTGSAILCITNRMGCCRNPFRGEWYYPNGTVVGTIGANEDFFRGRGDDQSVRLNRRNNAQSPTGSFCCELPDDSDMTHRVCVILVSAPFSIINTAGEQYQLSCILIDSTDTTPAFLWTGPPNDSPLPSDTRMVSDVMSSGSTHISILQFNPLQSSHEGNYTCQVTVEGMTEMTEFTVDIDECMAPDPCGNQNGYDCVNTVGSFMCNDINECTNETADCVDGATCVNTDGSFTCTCPSGLTGDGRDSGSGCMDIDECSEDPDRCRDGYRCANTLGSFRCDDIDECKNGTDVCVTNATCMDTDGSFTCTCPPGFTGDGRDSGSGCTDIDECTEDTDNCANGYDCANIPGSFSCNDINECTNGADDCVDGAICVNTDGSFTCTCPSGLTGDGRKNGSGCTDINECSEDTDRCGDGYRCANTLRNFRCDDINECKNGANDCVEGACNNTDGSFTCTCPSGFTGDGRDSGSGCTDINECTNGTDDCVDGATCNNTDGNFTCTCPSGLSGDGRDSGSRCTVPVQLIFHGVHVSYPNNSELFIGDIGDTSTGSAILCTTNKSPCCSTPPNRFGEWYYPDGSMVPNNVAGEDFFRGRGDNQTIWLNRRNNAQSPNGSFCCELPDNSDVTHRVCVILRHAFVTSTSTPSSTNTASEQPTSDQPISEQRTSVSTKPETDSTDTNSVDDTEEAKEGGATTGTIAGGAIVVLLVLGVVILLSVLLLLYLRHRRKASYSSSGPFESMHMSDRKSSTPRPLTTDLEGLCEEPTPEKVEYVAMETLIQEFPEDTTAGEGEGVVFKVKVKAHPKSIFVWLHNDREVKSDYSMELDPSDGSLRFPSVEPRHSGTYKLVVKNDEGHIEREVKLTVLAEGENPVISGESALKSSPVPVADFGKYVSNLHSNSNTGFKEQYQLLDSGEEGHTITVGVTETNRPLNRFANITVYDDNRIQLSSMKGEKSKYINACYIDGLTSPKKFIATQAPLPNTLADFWRLVWQEKPPIIVMVTNLKEGNRIKCEQYWPDSGCSQFGPFEVSITDHQIFADYIMRNLIVNVTGRTQRPLKVTQYHFTAWPDHGVPDYATSVLAFHRRVKSQHVPTKGPLLVHCSAGVGRTGTYMAIDSVLEQIERDQLVDIPAVITAMRRQRMRMVQTPDQYSFIHDAILESVTCGDTQIQATDLRREIQKLEKIDPLNNSTGFNYQFKVLEQVSPQPDEVISKVAKMNSKKNRSNKYLPSDKNRVLLIGEQQDYIHAVSVNGYKRRRAFFIAEGPMKNTVRNFWKMIFDRKCSTIVMLSGFKENGKESCQQYWPTSGTGQYGEFTVENHGEEKLGGFTLRSFSLMDSKTLQGHQIFQYHITGWSVGGECSNLKSITDVIEDLTKVQMRTSNKPAVVHCSDTVTRSGMFCAIATTIERCKTEGVVDVFQVVKALRVQKPGAVPTVNNYKLVFQAVLAFLDSFDTYANFS